MKTPTHATPLSVLRAQLLPVLMVFVLPLLSLGFTHYALRSLDDTFLRRTSIGLEREAQTTPAERAELEDFIRHNPPSEACSSSDPALAGYRRNLSRWCGDIRQFLVVRRVSGWALALGLFGTLLGAGFALLAHLHARSQYLSFVVGWRAMQVFAAVETVTQCAIAVWLAYWVTAFFFNVYIPQLILLVALLAGIMAVVVVWAIFVPGPPPPPVEAVRVPEAGAPALFARVRELCAQVGTAAPANLLAGIDDNFFVTEAGLDAVDGRVEGRSLYVSLALLRVLDRAEADAVLAHEMGHFVGGDTDFSRRMGPRLAASVRYLEALHGAVRPAFLFMRAYFAAFDLALLRTQREREFAADAVAVRAVSGGAFGRALVKIAAYSRYRDRVEASLLAHDRTHDSLAIAARIAEGFAGYVGGDDFARDMRGVATPHPFDTHPQMDARLDAMGARIPASEYAAVALAPAADGWRDAVADVEAIEGRLWRDYEARFADAHEQLLAYRYLPATPEEEALVAKHFPPRTFAYGSDTITLDYKSITTPDWGPLPLEKVQAVQVNERVFKKYLDVIRVDGQQHELLAKKLGKELELVQATLILYASRDLTAREEAAKKAAAG